MRKGSKMSEEHKRKLSEANKGKHNHICSEETRNKMSEAGKKRPPISEETRRKRSESMKGKNLGKHPSEETRNKMSKALKGIKRSEEFKKETSKRLTGNTIWLGRKHTEETRRRISESNKGLQDICGNKNPNWKGGVSFEPYCEIWSDEEYKQSIRDRDKNQCRKCGITRHISYKVYEQSLHIHHIDYDKKNCKPDNLITLCISCNTKANSNREHHTIFYKSIVKGV